jgi:hypothetical protein
MVAAASARSSWAERRGTCSITRSTVLFCWPIDGKGCQRVISPRSREFSSLFRLEKAGNDVADPRSPMMLFSSGYTRIGSRYKRTNRRMAFTIRRFVNRLQEPEGRSVRRSGAAAAYRPPRRRSRPKSPRSGRWCSARRPGCRGDNESGCSAGRWCCAREGPG